MSGEPVFLDWLFRSRGSIAPRLPCVSNRFAHSIMSDSSVVHISSDNFASEVEQSEVPVLVDFWSEHCGPCKMLSPVLDEVAGQLGTKAKIAKVDVMANRELAMKFGVRAVPTLLFLKGGEVKETKVGMMAKDAIVEKLNALA